MNVLSGLGSRKAPAELHRELVLHGFRSSDMRANGKSGIERIFASIFALQLGVLREARRLGLQRPKFLDSRSAMAVSNAMIY